MVVSKEKELDNAQQLSALGKLFWTNHDELATIQANLNLQTTKEVKCFDEMVKATLNELQFSIRVSSMMDDQAPKAVLQFNKKYDAQRRHLMTCWPTWGRTFELFYFYVLTNQEPDFQVFQAFADYIKDTLGTSSPEYIIAHGYSAWREVQDEMENNITQR